MTVMISLMAECYRLRLAGFLQVVFLICLGSKKVAILHWRKLWLWRAKLASKCKDCADSPEDYRISEFVDLLAEVSDTLIEVANYIEENL